MRSFFVLSTVEQAEVRFAADEINGRPRAVLDWDSPAARFAALQTVAALQAKALSDETPIQHKINATVVLAAGVGCKEDLHGLDPFAHTQCARRSAVGDP